MANIKCEIYSSIAYANEICQCLVGGIKVSLFSGGKVCCFEFAKVAKPGLTLFIEQHVNFEVKLRKLYDSTLNSFTVTVIEIQETEPGYGRLVYTIEHN